MLISAMTTKQIAESRGIAGQEWERYFTKRLGNVSTAWPSFTDFPTDRECCLGNSRVTLVGLIIAIFGVAFMFGGHPVIAVMLLLLAWVLMMLDEDMRSG
jgi:hypothetical protein